MNSPLLNVAQPEDTLVTLQIEGKIKSFALEQQYDTNNKLFHVTCVIKSVHDCQTKIHQSASVHSFYDAKETVVKIVSNDLKINNNTTRWNVYNERIQLIPYELLLVRCERQQLDRPYIYFRWAKEFYVEIHEKNYKSSEGSLEKVITETNEWLEAHNDIKRVQNPIDS